MSCAAEACGNPAARSVNTPSNEGTKGLKLDPTGPEGRGRGRGSLMRSAQLSRRSFVAWVGGASAGFYLFGRLPGTSSPVAIAQIPGGTLTRLSSRSSSRRCSCRWSCSAPGRSWKGREEHRLLRDLDEAVPAADPAAGAPPTTVWGYGAKVAQSNRGLLVHNAPSLTIEAKWNRPVRVKWINELVDEGGNYLPHLLPVDPDTALGETRPGVWTDGTRGRDFEKTPGPYTGPVPIVTHVHGAVGVADDSDGYAEAWYLPDANDIPGSHARKGAGMAAGKAAASYGVTWDAASRPSSTRMRTGHRRSGTTITRSA